jgi:ribosome-binding protein aMBF1 (putative translation factor)
MHASHGRSVKSFINNVGNYPLAKCRQPQDDDLQMAKRRKQIHPHAGVEKAFGAVVRATREKLGMSQMILQTRTGLDRTFISDLERGVQCPSLRTVFRIAKGLNMTPSNLIRLTAESLHFVFPVDDEDL